MTVNRNTMPSDVRERVRCEFARELETWITTLERDMRMLELRGNSVFAGQVRDMVKRARHVLDVT